MTFFESLEAAAGEKGGPLCVGIDPRVEPGPGSFDALRDYGRRVADACAPFAVAFKPQLAFFERHGPPGWEALEEILTHIRDLDPDFPVILDAKRGDIGSTAEAYAQALLERPGNLAVTLSPYLGRESVEPFLRRPRSGAFLLCRTSNPGAEALQERRLANGRPLYLGVADEVFSWNPNPEAPQIGLVVAGNDPAALAAVRRCHPDAWFLAPGVGTQGGRPDEVVASGGRADGFGVLASASRSVADASNPAKAAESLRNAMDAAREGGRRTLAAGMPETPPAESPPTESPPTESPPAKPLSADERETLLEGIFRIGAFKTGEFILKSGQKSPFYIDLRRLGADPNLLALGGRAYASLLADSDARHIAGIPVAALPLAAAASLASGMSLIYPRLERKSHGSGARVEGAWMPGEKAVLLDDLITSGGSKIEAATILREAGLLVEDLVVLLERGGGRREMEEAGLRLRSWARIEDLLDAGLRAGFLDRKSAREVRDYVGHS